MKQIFTSHAHLPTGLAQNVLLEIREGKWHKITPDFQDLTALKHDEKIDGTLIPALINTHSHAFQRVFAGKAERRENPVDDFWSWRSKMYQAALSLSPSELFDVALKLYKELIDGGYAHICEFHYLHHDKDGAPYKNPFLLGETLVEAANKAGLGITMLPVLYERAGFAASGLQEDQRRFKTTPEWVLEAQKHFKGGIAIHSLRAAHEHSLQKLVETCGDIPIHIHVSEQVKEVEDCLKTHGKRPIEFILPQLDARWSLVHATHTTNAELDGVAKSGANIVLCPATEANLGDGICDVTGMMARDIPLSIGSDSHISRSFHDELRLLEYGQRLIKRQRSVLDDIFSRVVNTRAAGHKAWGLIEGAPANALLLDASLDEHIFSQPAPPYKAIYLRGEILKR